MNIKSCRYVKSEKVVNKQDLYNQFLWYNRNIKIDNKTVFSNRLFKCGMWTVNDLYQHGRLIPFNTWIRRGASLNEYLLWRGIVKAIPSSWSNLLQQNIEMSTRLELGMIEFDMKCVNIMQATEKDFKDFFRYRRYGSLKTTEFKTQMKYTGDFDLDLESWSEIYSLPFKILIDNKIKDLQYRIMHRYIGTNKLLYKIGRSTTPK